MNYCKYCGNKINGENDFCTNCGNKIENNISKPEIINIDEDVVTNNERINLVDKYCQRCKAKLNYNEQICPVCGNYSNNQKNSNNYDETIINSKKQQTIIKRKLY